MTTRYRMHWPTGHGRRYYQNLRHTSPFQMAITLEILEFVEAYLGYSWDCLHYILSQTLPSHRIKGLVTIQDFWFFFLILFFIVHGHTSVEKNPGKHLFLQIGRMCTCVGTGGGEGQEKRDVSRGSLKKNSRRSRVK